jgi:hypothetical protein
MIADFFKQSKPIVFLVLGIILSLLFYTNAFFSQDVFSGLPEFALTILNHVILILSFILFKLSIKRYEIQKGHSLVSLFFVLFICLNIPEITINTELYCFLVLSLSVVRILQFIEKPENSLYIFDAVMLMTVASLLYKPALLCLILILAAILLFSSPRWNYFVVPILGVSTVIIFVQVFFLVKYDVAAQPNFFIPELEFSTDIYYTKFNSLLFPFWLFSGIVCIYQIFSVRQVRSLYHRKMASFFLVFLVIAFLSMGFKSSTLSGLWMLSLWPLCIYLGDFLSRLRKRLWLQVYLWSFIICSLSIYTYKMTYG